MTTSAMYDYRNLSEFKMVYPTLKINQTVRFYDKSDETNELQVNGSDIEDIVIDPMDEKRVEILLKRDDMFFITDWFIVDTEEQETKPKKTYRKGTFEIDMYPYKFKGFTDGSTWNGWAIPCFTKEEGMRIIDKLFSKNEPVTDFELEYNKDRDAFVEIVDDGEDSYDDKGFDIEVDGEIHHVYGIGADSWVWTEVGQPESPVEEYKEVKYDDDTLKVRNEIIEDYNNDPLIASMRKLREAFLEVNEHWDTKYGHILGSDKAIEQYPFENSFDEQTCEVANWVDTVIEMVMEKK